ncbi:MAG: hypothetical protein JWP87_3786 [Labilithrix sp.]|nr:hypothetical protein [Labilithrix sp.]
MIGKSLRERHTLSALPEERAVAVLRSMLASQAGHLVEVRAQDPRMIACLVVRADEASIRLCRALGFRVKKGGTGVFGMHGTDLVGFLPDLASHQRAWLETPCGPRETKVFLVAGGTALLSVETNEGKVAISAVP